MFKCVMTTARQLEPPDEKAIVSVRLVKFLDQLIFMYLNVYILESLKKVLNTSKRRTIETNQLLIYTDCNANNRLLPVPSVDSIPPNQIRFVFVESSPE